MSTSPMLFLLSLTLSVLLYPFLLVFCFLPVLPSALPSSQSSSACPSPALSTESLSSSSSDHGFPRTTATATPTASQRQSVSEQEHLVTKSVSEPSINSPGSSPSALSSEPKSHFSPGPAPSQPYSNTCSAPATPETNRSAGSKVPRLPPPRPPTAPSPLIGSPSSQPCTPNKVSRFQRSEVQSCYVICNININSHSICMPFLT